MRDPCVTVGKEVDKKADIEADRPEQDRIHLMLSLFFLRDYTLPRMIAPEKCREGVTAPARLSRTATVKSHVHDSQKPIEETMPRQPTTPSIAERIKAERARRGLSQSEAARAWEISVRTLQEWEQGRAKPRGLYLQAVERILAGSGPGAKRRE
jgi:DNA-binding transcriptional regulator YiaG